MGASESLWEFIDAKHDAFPRERYESIVDMVDAGGETGSGMEDMARLKLRFHDYVDDNPRSYVPNFAALYRRYVFEYIYEHVEVDDDTVDVETVISAITHVLDDVEGTALDDLDRPFKGVTDVLRTGPRTDVSDANKWEELRDVLAELEELDSFTAVRTVWRGSQLSPP